MYQEISMRYDNEPTFRELVANIIDWRARLIPPQRQRNYAAAVVAQVFGLARQMKLDDGRVGQSYSANELLDQAAPWLEPSEGAEVALVANLFLVMNETEEKFRETYHEDFGAWCDRLVNEAQLPHRNLEHDGVLSLTKELQIELLRRQHPVAR